MLGPHDKSNPFHSKLTIIHTTLTPDSTKRIHFYTVCFDFSSSDNANKPNTEVKSFLQILRNATTMSSDPFCGKHYESNFNPGE